MDNSELTLAQRLNLETARIPWAELQGHFASGSVISVGEGLDLIAVAETLAKDDADQVKAWMESGQVAPVSDDQARHWHKQEAHLWAVVIKPWVLVQYRP